MLTEKIKNGIKRNRRAKSLALQIKTLIPPKFIYSEKYFYILNLCNSYKKNKQSVLPVLKKQLAFLLKDCLANVPYYKEITKIRTEEINEENSYDILVSFPYLDKKTVMDNKESFLNKRFDRRKLFYGTSGGSTGQGIGVWRTKEETDTERAFFDFEWGKLGFNFLKSRTVRFGTEARKKENEYPVELAGNRLLISPYHLTDRWIEIIYSEIVAFKPDFIHTYPSCMEYVARYIKKSGKPKLKIKGLLLASEIFLPEQLKLFQETIEGSIISNYGLAERTNLAFSHIEESDFFYRLVDVYSFSENRKDEWGNFEIVGTSYWHSAMPLIRYRTQDFGKIEEGNIIRRLDGRNQEFLISKTGSKIPGFSIKIDEFTWDFIDTYQVVQTKMGAIILRVVPRKKLNEDIKKLILKKQKERWGDFFDITLEIAENIPRTVSGKRRLIINNIQKK